MNEKNKYDSTVARIAGNITSGYVGRILPETHEAEIVVAQWAVRLARAIVAETLRTEPNVQP